MIRLKDVGSELAGPDGKLPQNLVTGLGEQLGKAEVASEQYKEGQAAIQGG